MTSLYAPPPAGSIEVSESIIRPEQHTYRDLIWILPFAPTALIFVFLHLVQHSGHARSERFSFYMMMSALFLVMLGNAGLMLNQQVLALFSLPYAALLAISLLVFGIGTWRAGVMPN